MALNGKLLGDSIASLIVSADADAESKKKIMKLWEDIGGCIVNHITQNAQITVAAGIPVATAGSPAAQTGSTTAPGTATIL